MRVAWFSPLPPVRSGIAAYTAELIPHLADTFAIDCYGESNAHDFVWMHQRQPYDLTVYQLGNARCHDYMWAYLVRYPGLVVLHDARLHHARARHLLAEKRVDDYRQEFRYDHPAAPPGADEYAIEGLKGSIYYFWPMIRVPMITARAVAVHNARVAGDLRSEYPGACIEAIRMGVGASAPPTDARARLRREWQVPDDGVVFAAFGKVTPEKRIAAMLEGLATLRREAANVWLLLVGDAEDYERLQQDLQSHHIADRVRLTGWVDDDAIDGYLAAADACLCLRWPTALETSASWLRCVAAGRATVISDLAHLVDIPDAVALRVDVLDETAGIADAMRRLAGDAGRRRDLERAARQYWTQHHTLELMAEDYRTTLLTAAARPAPIVGDLPPHFTRDFGGAARAVAREFGVEIALLNEA
jgi:glycosyltransferase involved in cell wall biosynthesis